MQFGTGEGTAFICALFIQVWSLIIMAPIIWLEGRQKYTFYMEAYMGMISFLPPLVVDYTEDDDGWQRGPPV